MEGGSVSYHQALGDRGRGLQRLPVLDLQRRNRHRDRVGRRICSEFIKDLALRGLQEGEDIAPEDQPRCHYHEHEHDEQHPDCLSAHGDSLAIDNTEHDGDVESWTDDTYDGW